MPNDAVVTGLGTIGPWGRSGEDLARALLAGKPLAAEVERRDGLHPESGSRLAALVRDRDLSGWIAPAAARRMCFPSQLVVAAARMALAEAGLTKGDSDGSRLGVFLSTTFGPGLYTELLLKQVLLEGAQTAQPFYFSECVANAPSAQLAIALGARGPNMMVTQRESGPILAVARAAQAVREGRVDRALAGAVEEMTPLLHALLDRFGALARQAQGRPEMPRPFDPARNGFLAGEGATILLLEREEAARARGARARARIGWSGAAFDSTAGVSDWGDGQAPLAAALRAGLDRSPGGAAGIGAIVSGASGSRRGDRLEGAVLRACWGEDAPPPILAPKAVTGEYGGGVIAPGLLALEGAPFGPLPGAIDPEIGVTPHHGGARPRPERVLLTGLASGGGAAWLVLERIA